ncbi:MULTISPECIES: hypothetical protein [Methylobacterium]|nr:MULTISPECIES: hypothetical protein [Methylobacterium]MDR7035740.1 hypothetical protein [Methylobacterium sp. BE186]
MSHALAQFLLTVASVMAGILFLDAVDAPARKAARRLAGVAKALQGK